MADGEGLVSRCSTCLTARTANVDFGLRPSPLRADLRSVGAAERRSSSLREVSSACGEMADGEGLPALRFGCLAALGSNFVLIPPRGFKRLRRNGGWGGIACASLRLSRCARLELRSHPSERFQAPAAKWRMGRDSNPRCIAAHTLSKRAHSTTLPPILKRTSK
jgi:hypothetical protein